MDITNSKRTVEVLEAVTSFLAQPSPRVVPGDLLKSAGNRFARSLLLLSGFFILFEPCLFAVIAYANKTVSFGPGVIPAYVLYGALCVLFMWALILHRKPRMILANGALYEGKIRKIRTLPLRMAATSYYAVSVEFTDGNGEKRKVWDAVDNLAVEQFYQAYSDDDSVSLVFSQKAPRDAILVMKLPYQVLS